MKILPAVFAATVCLGLLLGGCNITAMAYCNKAIECERDDCDLTDQACNAKYEGAVDRCTTHIRDDQNAIRTGSDPDCGECTGAQDSLMMCQGNTSSCAAFKDSRIGKEHCEDEHVKVREKCEDIRDKCMK